MFRMIGCVPIDSKDESLDLSTYFQYYFYPATVTGPWITLTSFENAKSKIESKSEVESSGRISNFLQRVTKWALVLLVGELFHHLFYINR